jgi:hypothetical protein
MTMSVIQSGFITAFYLFDIAEEIDLARVPTCVHTATTPARLVPKPATPAYLQYESPAPLVLDGEAVQATEIDGFRVRIKLFEYGVVSIALSRPFAGPWSDLLAAGQHLVGGAGLERQAAAVCRRVAETLTPALDQPHRETLAEDYVVFAVTALDEPRTGDELIEHHGDDIAHLLRGERAGLSRQERDEVLRHRISYLADDLVVPTWNAGFVYDTEAGVQAALEIFEFANSQLLEFRYYDDLLDNELKRIYDSVEEPRWYDTFGRRYTRAANELHALLIEVNELTDKTENALKLVGDVYAARLYSLVAARLGLDRWKQNVADKLKTLDDIYRYSVEQTQMTRGHFLEAAIIAILLFELALFFMGIMK